MSVHHRIKNPGFILVFVFSFIISFFSIQAQTRINGQVKDDKGKPLPYASIYIENTIDGTTTDSLGRFSFKTNSKGKRVLITSFIGYETKKDSIVIDKSIITHNVIVNENTIAMQEVVVTAGAFEANDDQKVAVLKPLDIYSNAGAGGDIVGAIRTLPGNQAQSDQTGLFVRGGDASESVVIVDGMTVQNPFSSNVPGVSQRSRFTPFQFKGISFSSGGYSARYGQALSSILELNTFDLPENSTANLSVGMTGIEASGTKKWNSSAFELTGHYENLKPFFSLAKTNIHFYEEPTGGGFSTKYTLLGTKKDLLKIFLKYEGSSSGTDIPGFYSPNSTDSGQQINNSAVPFGLKNENAYFNTSYNHLYNKLLIRSAISASNNTDKIEWNYVPSKNNDWRIDLRSEALYNLSDKFNFLGGVELNEYQFIQSDNFYNPEFKELLSAGYFEFEWRPVKWFAFKQGIRFENSNLLNKNNMAVRLAMAIGTGQYSQISLAGGTFYQDPDKNYLLAGYRPKFQEAVHYIGNFQWIKNDRTFRIEGYYKSYNQLVREDSANFVPYDGNTYRLLYCKNLDNSGSGYATGIDLFWRDKGSINNFDYWVSYSFIDTKRLYRNYWEKATPSFVSKNNLNLLVKYFIEALQLNIGLSYTYASGRLFYDPAFVAVKTPDYHTLSFNCSYLVTVGRFFGVAYMSIDNLTGRKNIYGYNYSPQGQSYEIKPALDRWIYAGFTIALTRFKKEEL
jgi:outer membrane cobalamin receptor